MNNPRITEMTKQVEYYMSDQNLKTDKFFHNMIASSKDQLIQLNVLLNCRKIQKLKPSIRDLQEAIQGSDQLTISADKTLFGRKKKTLPVLRENCIILDLGDEEAERKVKLTRSPPKTMR